MTTAIADIIIECPAINSETDGWFFDLIRSDANPYKAKFKRPDGSFISIVNKTSAVLRCNGTNWRFD
jgi:hypothetical protein